MEIKQQSTSGYIMIFTLLIIAASMVLVSYVSHRAALYMPFINMAIARQKAQFLAHAGINIAIAQLSKTPQKKESRDDKKETMEDENVLLLRTILPTLNLWQSFNLTQEHDGIDGQINLCLMCEEGKININRMYNFKKEMFRGSKDKGWKQILQELCKNIEKTTKGSDLFAAFEKIFKERRSKYNDATELVTKKEFYYFKDFLFYQPSPEDKEKKQQFIYLTDIFTPWTSSGKIEPWLFSHSLMILLGLQSESDIKKRKELIEGWLKPFKKDTQWQQDWKTILQPIYAKELRSLPKYIDSVLSTHFDPHFFSVRVHATVDNVMQQVYAILERVKRMENNEIVYDIFIRKLYWL